MPYPDSVLRRGEHVLAHRRPHWRMLVVPVLVVPVAAFLAAFAAALVTGVASDGVRTALWVAVLVVAVAALVRFAVVPLLRWRCTHFVVTDRRLLVREGVVTRESVDVAGSSITTVRARTTPRERLVGCGTLVVATASTSEPWEFAGLGGVERLVAVVERMAADRGGLREPDEEEPEDEWGAWADAEDPEDAEDEDAEDPAPVVGGARLRRRRGAGRTSR